MAKKILAVGLKKAEYAVAEQSGTPLTFTEIDVVHDDTFEYTFSEAVYEDYINMLTKKRYYRRKSEEGNSEISFSIGQYTMADKATFMGGTAKDDKWTPSDGEEVYLAIRVTTEDNVQITIPYASISATHNRNQSALGLMVTASPVQSPDGVTPMEEWEIVESA